MTFFQWYVNRGNVPQIQIVRDAGADNQVGGIRVVSAAKFLAALN